MGGKPAGPLEASRVSWQDRRSDRSRVLRLPQTSVVIQDGLPAREENTGGTVRLLSLFPQIQSVNSMKLFTGRAHPALARRICEYLGLPLGRAVMGNFPDGEISCKIDEDVRGRDVFILQPTCPPVNENLMELLIMIESFKRASADRITAVIPYFGYARQDRKDEGRVPITAKLVANLITRAGADRVLTMDLHAAQIQGFFDIPVDHLYAAPVIDEYFKAMDIGRRRVRGRQPRRGQHQAGLGPHVAPGRPPGHHRQAPQHGRADQAGQRHRRRRSRAAWP